VVLLVVTGYIGPDDGETLRKDELVKGMVERVASKDDCGEETVGLRVARLIGVVLTVLTDTLVSAVAFSRIVTVVVTVVKRRGAPLVTVGVKLPIVSSISAVGDAGFGAPTLVSRSCRRLSVLARVASVRELAAPKIWELVVVCGVVTASSGVALEYELEVEKLAAAGEDEPVVKPVKLFCAGKDELVVKPVKLFCAGKDELVVKPVKLFCAGKCDDVVKLFWAGNDGRVVNVLASVAICVSVIKFVSSKLFDDFVEPAELVVLFEFC
jgi:hypothetical protein